MPAKDFNSDLESCGQLGARIRMRIVRNMHDQIREATHVPLSAKGRGTRTTRTELLQLRPVPGNILQLQIWFVRQSC